MIKTPNSLPNLKTYTPTKASWNCLKEEKEIIWLKEEEEEVGVNQESHTVATLDLATTTTVEKKKKAVVGGVVFSEETNDYDGFCVMR